MKVWIRTPFVFAALLAAAALGACSDDDDPGGINEEEPPPMEVTVEMQDNVFDDMEVRVAVGGTVTWVNVGNNPHTSTSDDDIWDSGTVPSGGDPFERTFDEAGEFNYFCEFHGSPGQGMWGTVVVEEVE